MSNQPTDVSGAVLAPTDLVKVNAIPEYYYEEFVGAKMPESQITDFIKGFAGSYGYVSYHLDQLYLFENETKVGWARQDLEGGWEVCVTLVKLDERHLINQPCIVYREFWVRCRDVEKLPFNILIASIFGGHQWQISDHTKAPMDRPLLTQAMSKFDFVRRVLETPFDRLRHAHDAAIENLD